jgi:hypothetical protein
MLGHDPSIDLAKYTLVLDRISHEIPFYRALLHQPYSGDPYLLNRDVDRRHYDQYTLLRELAGLGFSIPPMILLPHHQHPNELLKASFRNLRYPLDWQKIFSEIRFPAILKSIDMRPEISFWVKDSEAFFHAYHRSGTRLMMLQQAFEPTSYFRVYVLDQQNLYAMPYDHRLSGPLRYQMAEHQILSSAHRSAINDHLKRLASLLQADFMQVEVALSFGQPYVTDIMFSTMDADYNLVGKVHFEWIVKNMGQMMVKKALRHTPFRTVKDTLT